MSSARLLCVCVCGCLLCCRFFLSLRSGALAAPAAAPRGASGPPPGTREAHARPVSAARSARRGARGGEECEEREEREERGEEREAADVNRRHPGDWPRSVGSGTPGSSRILGRPYATRHASVEPTRPEPDGLNQNGLSQNGLSQNGYGQIQICLYMYVFVCIYIYIERERE